MILSRAEIAKLAKLNTERTQGTWQWTGHQSGNDIRLQSNAKWRPIVMDFVRWGFQGAGPRFRDAERDVMERFRPILHNPDNPESQIIAIDHPDAAFIVAAVNNIDNLLATVEAYRQALTFYADPEIYRVTGRSGAGRAIEGDTGKRARQVLREEAKDDTEQD